MQLLNRVGLGGEHRSGYAVRPGYMLRWRVRVWIGARPRHCYICWIVNYKRVDVRYENISIIALTLGRLSFVLNLCEGAFQEGLRLGRSVLDLAHAYGQLRHVLAF